MPILTPLVGSYSFLDTQVTLLSNSMAITMGAVTLGEQGIADEGIRYAPIGEKNTLTMGADGSGMHSLRAANAALVTINLLKMSPINAQLSAVYAFQIQSAAFWGGNQITINQLVTGDNIECYFGAFRKHADVGFRTEGEFLVWEFQFVSVVPRLGNGYQAIQNLNFNVAA